MVQREEVLEREVFSVDGRGFTWSDVVAAARAWSDWGEIERRARQAIGPRTGVGEEVDANELEEAQNRFRYDRNLLAADELEEWLGRWGVSVEEWLAQIRGAVHRSRLPSASAAATPADPEGLQAATWVEAVCSGELERLARKLAERFAVFGEGQLAELTAEAVSRMDEAHRSFCEAAVTEEALERRLADEGLEWTRVEGRYLAHPDENVVREAAHGVREENRDLGEMARLAGARYEPAARFYLADLDADLKARLLATSPGELCGPFASGKEHWLFEVGARTPPTLDDPELRARAEAELVERAIEQELLRRVRWREQPAS